MIFQGSHIEKDTLSGLLKRKQEQVLPCSSEARVYFPKDISIKIVKNAAAATKNNSNVTPCNNGAKVYSNVSVPIQKRLKFKSLLLPPT